MPCAMRSPKRPLAAHSASVCCGWVSPVRLAKPTTSPSVTVRPDPSAYAMRLLRRFGRIRDEAPGALVMTMTYPDLSRFVPLRPRTEVRVKRGMDLYNDALRGVARRRGVIVIEAAGHPGAGDRGNFADDGFHASADGHRRIAAGVVSELRRLHERVG